MQQYVPLGYDVKDRKLIVNETEAETVRQIFALYLEIKSTPVLLERLRAEGVRMKGWMSSNREVEVGGRLFTKSALYSLLKNPIYIGMVSHKKQVHEGQHEPIMSKEIWEEVQTLMKQQAGIRSGYYATHPLLLRNKVFDVWGRTYRGHSSVKGKSRHYMYYFQEKAKHRIPTEKLDSVILSAIRHPALHARLPLNEEQLHRWKNLWQDMPLLPPAEQARVVQVITERIVVGEQITLQLRMGAFAEILTQTYSLPKKPKSQNVQELLDVPTVQVAETLLEVKVNVSFPKEKIFVPSHKNQFDETLLRAIGHAYRWNRMLMEKPDLTQQQLAKQEGVHSTYISRCISLLTLAPEILEAILNGRGPAHMTMEYFKRVSIPVCWKAQRQLLLANPQ